MKIIFIVLFSVNLYSQCNVTSVDYNTLPSGWTLGNSCGVEYYTEAQQEGDLILKEDCFIRNAKLIVTGQIIYNGYTITLECDNSELIELRLSSKEIELKKPILYPNPTKDKFYINTKERYKTEIYNLKGQKVKKLTHGIYIVKVIIVNKEYVYKVVKQ